jgi:ubiquinone/menaquinone biosynthesis C-methylase UbiE
MSAREKEMERVLSRRGRSRRFEAVIAQMRSEASSVLDLGCGTGALAASLIERFPSAVIVGIDRSRFLLSTLQRRRIALTVLGDVSTLPFRDEVFDMAIAIQVLHEIVASDGSELLVKTLRNIRKSIRQGGEFVIFDHLSPGEAPVSLQLSDEMLTRLREFQAKFQYRQISFHDYGDGHACMEGFLRLLYEDLGVEF